MEGNRVYLGSLEKRMIERNLIWMQGNIRILEQSCGADGELVRPILVEPHFRQPCTPRAIFPLDKIFSKYSAMFTLQFF
jgi:hypothetical protein